MAISYTLPYEKPVHIWPSLKIPDIRHKRRYLFYTHSFYMYEEPSNPEELICELNKSEEWVKKFQFMKERGAHIEMQAAPSYMNHNIKVGFWARFPEEKLETEFLLKYGICR